MTAAFPATKQTSAIDIQRVREEVLDLHLVCQPGARQPEDREEPQDRGREERQRRARDEQQQPEGARARPRAGRICTGRRVWTSAVCM